MVFTLAGFAKYIKNVTPKNYDILTILLSWYMYIESYVNKISETNFPETTLRHLESIEITNYRVKRYLKRFNLNNCQIIEEFND